MDKHIKRTALTVIGGSGNRRPPPIDSCERYGSFTVPSDSWRPEFEPGDIAEIDTHIVTFWREGYYLVRYPAIEGSPGAGPRSLDGPQPEMLTLRWIQRDGPGRLKLWLNLAHARLRTEALREDVADGEVPIVGFAIRLMRVHRVPYF